MEYCVDRTIFCLFCQMAAFVILAHTYVVENNNYSFIGIGWVLDLQNSNDTATRNKNA